MAHALQGITEVNATATITSIDGISAYDLTSRRAMLGRHPELVLAHLERIGQEHQILLDRTPLIQDVHGCCLHCASARANYMVRVVQPGSTRNFCEVPRCKFVEMLGGHLANTVGRCRSEEHWFLAHGTRWHRVAKRRENVHTSILGKFFFHERNEARSQKITSSQTQCTCSSNLEQVRQIRRWSICALQIDRGRNERVGESSATGH